MFGLVLPFSSFFFTLLKYYSLQLQHLSPQSIMLVAIFMHICEMYVCMWPSVHLFHRFHVLHFASRRPTHITSYYFQHWAKGPSKYTAALSPMKCDRWREDWVIELGGATIVAGEDIDDGPPGGSVGGSDSGHHSSWRRC
jgi:hypothetical protein